MPDVTLGPPPIDRRRPRAGCMGCLTRLFISAVGVILICLVATFAMEFLFHPWSLYAGGHLHFVPGWQGITRVHRADGDYTLYFWIEPTNSGRYEQYQAFKGNGYLCTPRGERFPLGVYGHFTESVTLDTNGKHVKIEFKRRPWYFKITGPQYDRRPRITFGGVWQNPKLVGDDGGSFAAAFLPDGSMNRSQAQYDYYHANAPNKLPMTIQEVSGWQPMRQDCRAK